MVQTDYVLFVLDKENKDLSWSIILLHKEEEVWSAFGGMENPCNEPWLREKEAEHCFISPNFRGNLV